MHISSDTRVRAGWLDALTYGDKLFNAMFWNRSTYINRNSVSDWRRLLVQSGWEVIRWRVRRWPLEHAFVGSKPVASPWSHLTADELAVGFIWFAAERMS